MLDDHVKEWVGNVLSRRADQSWEPVLEMNGTTAGDDTQVGEVSITINNTLDVGDVVIRGDAGAGIVEMARYTFSPSPQSSPVG